MDLIETLLAEIPLYAGPALFNIYFAAASLPIGFVFAVLLALGKNSKNPIVRRLCSAYIYAFRGCSIPSCWRSTLSGGAHWALRG